MPLGLRPGKILNRVWVYALTRSDLPETLDLFITREAAEAELQVILLDEPGWSDILSIFPVELDERDRSAN
jgi:hypothetical protein